MMNDSLSYLILVIILYSDTVSFIFESNLINGGSHCFAISAATATGKSPKIAASFVTNFSDHFWTTDFYVVFKFPSHNLQYGGSGTNCSRLGCWRSNFAVRHTACISLTSDGLGQLNLSPGFTEVCIYRGGHSDSGRPSMKATYYAGELVISGFSTRTTLSLILIRNPLCSVSFDVLNGTKNGS